jgi:hypothetical protein
MMSRMKAMRWGSTGSFGVFQNTGKARANFVPPP